MSNEKSIVDDLLEQYEKSISQTNTINPSNTMHYYDENYNISLSPKPNRKSRKKNRKKKHLNKKKSSLKRCNSLPPKKFKKKHNKNNNKKISVAESLRLKEENELTFKPKIKTYSFHEHQHPNVQTRLQIWLLKKQNKLKKLNNIYNDKDNNNDENQLTFKPKISKIPKFYKSKKNIQLKIPFNQRLIQNEIARKQKLRDTRNVIIKTNMKQCTFRPETGKTKTSKKISKKLSKQMPIWDRIEYETNKANEKKNDLKKKIAENEPFTPTINETSKKILQKNFEYNTNKNVIERLSKKPILTVDTNNDINTNNIVKPKISTTSNKILKESILYGKEGGNFFQRQKIYEFEKNMKHKKIEIEMKNEIIDKFKPEIGDTNYILSKSIKHGFRIETETKDEMFFRLAFHDLNEINKKIKLKRKEFEKDLTYKPKINQKSKKIGRPSSLYELIQPEKSLNYQKKIYNNHNKQFNIKHPFKPKIIKKRYKNKKYKRSMSLDSRYFSKKYEEMEKREILKEKKMQYARRQLDEITMKECTFKPKIKRLKKNKINKNKKNNNNINKVIIPGMNRFNELKLLKEKQLNEKLYYKENAFNVKSNCLKSRKKNANGKIYTIPKPFKLSSNKNENENENEINKCKKNIYYDNNNNNNVNINNENNELILIDLNKYNDEIIKDTVWNIVNNIDSDDDDKSSLNLSWIDN